MLLKVKIQLSLEPTWVKICCGLSEKFSEEKQYLFSPTLSSVGQPPLSGGGQMTFPFTIVNVFTLNSPLSFNSSTVAPP